MKGKMTHSKILVKISKKFRNTGDFYLTNRHLFVIIIWYEFLEQVYALLAQLDRVAHYECEGWGFESLMAHQKTAEFQQVQRFSFAHFSFHTSVFPRFFHFFTSIFPFPFARFSCIIKLRTFVLEH